MLKSLLGLLVPFLSYLLSTHHCVDRKRSLVGESSVPGGIPAPLGDESSAWEVVPTREEPKIEESVDELAASPQSVTAHATKTMRRGGDNGVTSTPIFAITWRVSPRLWSHPLTIEQSHMPRHDDNCSLKANTMLAHLQACSFPIQKISDRRSKHLPADSPTLTERWSTFACTCAQGLLDFASQCSRATQRSRVHAAMLVRGGTPHPSAQFRVRQHL